MKKVLCLLSTIALIFVCSITNVYALDVEENKSYDEIVDLSSYSNEYGKLNRVSKAIKTGKYESYDSWWAAWQPTVYIDKDKYVYDLYQHEKYVDIMVDEIEQFRIESGETFSKTFKYFESNSVTQSKASSKAISLFSSFEKSIVSSIGAVLDGFKFGITDADVFKIEIDYQNTITVSSSNTQTKSFEEEYTEKYYNNRDTYAYVTRGFRQKFRVLIGVIYEYIYDQKRSGSGLWGKDSNYSYTFKNYECKAINIYLLPEEDSYYDISYYIDDKNGNRKFADQTNNNIIFI